MIIIHKVGMEQNAIFKTLQPLSSSRIDTGMLIKKSPLFMADKDLAIHLLFILKSRSRLRRKGYEKVLREGKMF